MIMNEYQRFDTAPIRQHADKPHLLFQGAQSTLNSAVRSNNRRSVQGRGHQLLRRVGRAVRHLGISGGMIRARGQRQNTGVLSAEVKK
jgi:hypothetical protein